MKLAVVPTGIAVRCIGGLLLFALLAGCARSAGPPAAPSVAATVGGSRIPTTRLNGYMRYAIAFDTLAYPQSAEASCGKKPAGAACTRLRRETLARLIEEEVVVQWARHHGVRLTAADRAQSATQLRALSRQQGPPGRLLRATSRQFMLSVLNRETLVRKVEHRVAGTRAIHGPAVHIRIFTIPLTVGTNRAELYQHVLSVATGGSLPSGTYAEDSWKADFRLPSWLSSALNGVKPGEYVGPFQRTHSFVLVRLIARGTHRYAAPARRALTARYFHKWLHSQLQHTRLRCANRQGALRSCSNAIMNAA